MSMKIERIGSFKDMGMWVTRPYARTIYDMQRWGNRIYMGCGDSQSNRGPVPIPYIDLDSGSVERIRRDDGTIFTLPEEQTEKYRVLGGVLHIPGHDPRGTGPGFARLADGVWSRVGGGWPSKTAHVYDLCEIPNGTRFGSTGGGGPLCIRRPGATKWTRVAEVVGDRHYTNFEFEGKAFSFGLIPWDYAAHLKMFSQIGYPVTWASTQHDGTTPVHRTDLDVRRLFPGYTQAVEGFTKSTVHKLIRPTQFGSRLLIMGGRFSGDHDTEPHSASVVTTLAQGASVIHPIELEPTEKPWDFLVRGDVAYMLSSVLRPDGQHTIRVRESTDGVTWKVLFEFAWPCFARSFEEKNAVWYLGLGCLPSPVNVHSGDVLRVTTGTV
jgi:hypothetical protein